jgi:hypothetical protein
MPMMANTTMISISVKPCCNARFMVGVLIISMMKWAILEIAASHVLGSDQKKASSECTARFL